MTGKIYWSSLVATSVLSFVKRANHQSIKTLKILPKRGLLYCVVLAVFAIALLLYSELCWRYQFSPFKQTGLNLRSGWLGHSSINNVSCYYRALRISLTCELCEVPTVYTEGTAVSVNARYFTNPISCCVQFLKHSRGKCFEHNRDLSDIAPSSKCKNSSHRDRNQGIFGNGKRVSERLLQPKTHLLDISV